MERDGDCEAECIASESCRSSRGDGEREADLARSSSPFFMGDGERLRDFLLSDFSLERPWDPRSDLGLERDLERDLRASERERDFWLAEQLRDLRERERDFPVLDRDLRVGDLERDFLLDLDGLLLRDLDL